MDPLDPEATVALTRAAARDQAAEPEPIGHYLVVMDGGEAGRRIRIGATPITIGRDPARDLVLVDPDVSRLHAQVRLDGDRVTIEDQHSTNGTFVNGQKVASAVLTDGSQVQVGSHHLRLERRDAREVQRSEELARDLDKAQQYVRSLLPAPLTQGPVLTDWAYHPSLQLGGDAFGVDQLDAGTFVFYLIDVSGHGVGAAMHSVSVLNVLRQRALPGVDARDPAQVLVGLNAMFQMDRHDGMFFTMWYGVYDVASRALTYACAGHHAAYLVSADRTSVNALKTVGLMIGAAPEARYRTGHTTVEPGSVLHVFSDGVFEIVAADGRQWRLADFLPFLTASTGPDAPESGRLYAAVRQAARPGPLDDDFSLLVVTFP